MFWKSVINRVLWRRLFMVMLLPGCSLLLLSFVFAPLKDNTSFSSLLRLDVALGLALRVEYCSVLTIDSNTARMSNRWT